MNKDWDENKYAGTSAENAVEYLINSMPDWKCLKFGLENHVREIREMVRASLDPIAIKIKKMPDLIAFNNETKEILLIEVKYRSNCKGERFLFKYLENYQEHWKGTKMIIIRKDEPRFVYIDLEKVDESMREIKVIDGEWKTFWNFNEIEQGIKDLFPDLEDSKIEEALKRIV